MTRIREIAFLLRSLKTPWIVTALLPVPVILMVDTADNADVSLLYFGLGSAYLTAAFIAFNGYPASRGAWRTKIAAIAVALAVNVALLIFLGLTVGIETHLPYPLLAILSAVPSIGLVPWLIVSIRKPFVAMVLAALILLATKLAGCVLARIVYGPRFGADGYIAGDWTTAKLMISFFWIGVIVESLVAFLIGTWQFRTI